MDRNRALQMLKALADPQRLAMIEAIAEQGRTDCTQAGECTGLAQPTVSHHINKLVESQLIGAEKSGRNLRLKLCPKAMPELIAYLTELHQRSQRMQPAAEVGA